MSAKPLVTVIIPIALEHRVLAEAAIASAENQTIKPVILSAVDWHQEGPAAIRNEWAALAETPFVTFLDADDTLEPTFIEECLRAYEQGRYIYTGWYEGTRVRLPDADHPLANGGFHLVTTLIPTAAFQAVGGFNESLPGHEDIDLFLKLWRAGVCGKRVDKVLVHYNEHGIRSKAFVARPDYRDIIKQSYEDNGGLKTIMAKCGSCGGTQAPIPKQDAQPGDVQARTLWKGIKTVVGHSTGRSYRGGNDNVIPVAPADVEIMAQHFQRVLTAAELTPQTDDIMQLAGFKP